MALVLHLYQPPTQTSEELKVVTNECYIPLLKLLRSNKKLNITLNIPLSTLELFDVNGYSNVITGIKELVDLGRVELTGTGAYHPLLTKITPQFKEQQIVLHEYGLGYYLGRRKGFEGDNSVMYKDLNGFFPPELGVNSELIETLSDFGYSWCLVDECVVLPALTNNIDINRRSFKLDGNKTALVVRDTELSNMLSFKRNTSVSDLIDFMTRAGKSDFVIALDAEYFGHHYKQGLFVLDFLYQEFEKLGWGFDTITSLVEDTEPMPLAKIYEGTWGATSSDVVSGNPYPYWHEKGNDLQDNLWKLSKLAQESNMNFFTQSSSDEDLQNAPIWLESTVSAIKDEKLRESISTNIWTNKALHSDQYWWASGKQIFDLHLQSPAMIKKALEIYKKLLSSDELASNLIKDTEEKL